MHLMCLLTKKFLLKKNKNKNIYISLYNMNLMKMKLQERYMNEIHIKNFIIKIKTKNILIYQFLIAILS